MFENTVNVIDGFTRQGSHSGVPCYGQHRLLRRLFIPRVTKEWLRRKRPVHVEPRPDGRWELSLDELK
jgi:hypothetical protein